MDDIISNIENKIKKWFIKNKKYLLTSKKFFIQASKEGDYIVYYSPGPSEQKNTRLSIIRCDGKNNMNLADFYVS